MSSRATEAPPVFAHAAPASQPQPELQGQDHKEEPSVCGRSRRRLWPSPAAEAAREEERYQHWYSLHTSAMQVRLASRSLIT